MAGKDELLMKMFELNQQMYKYINGETQTKAVGNANTAQLLYGSNGLFDVAGIDRNVINTYIISTGMQEVLGRVIQRSNLENPIFATITGIQDDGAPSAEDVCGDAPTGNFKSCRLTSQFGRLAFQTQTIDPDRAIMVDNAGVNRDLVLLGGLVDNTNINPAGMTSSQLLESVTANEMLKVGMLMQNGTSTQMGLNRMIWQGNPSNNTAGGGYKEFPGFDQQIVTGQVDAIENVACEAMDSDVKDFNYTLIDTDNDLVEYITYMEMTRFKLAQDTKVAPVEWVFAMRPELWMEFSAVWPVAYSTNRGASVLPNNSRIILNANDVRAEVNRLRREMTIDVNGRTYRVIADDGIFEQNNINDGNLAAGEYASSIYFIPLRILGNFPVTYLEFNDYRQFSNETRRLMGQETFWTDGGQFSWAIDTNKWCYNLTAKTEPRLVVKTPQLAARLDNVRYAPLQRFRTSDPTSPYVLNGGVSNTGPVYNTSAVWK